MRHAELGDVMPLLEKEYLKTTKVLDYGPLLKSGEKR